MSNIRATAKLFLALIFLFFAIFIFNYFSSLSKSQSPDWLEGWDYRRLIAINNTHGTTFVDYPVLITLDTASLIAEGKMRSDCGDIRFTDSDGATLLTYWLEQECNTDNTSLWVRVPEIQNSKIIYLYYGNPSAGSLSTSFATEYTEFEIIIANEETYEAYINITYVPDTDTCPDTTCEWNEDAYTCPQDCAGTCGDGYCNPYYEDINTCAFDCGYCGDNVCGYGETPSSCPQDCVFVYRVPVTIYENLGRDRINYIFWVNLTIPSGHKTNCSQEMIVTQVVDGTEVHIPSRVVSEADDYCEIEFIGNLTANSSALFYVYYGTENLYNKTYNFDIGQFFVEYGEVSCPYTQGHLGLARYLNYTHMLTAGRGCAEVVNLLDGSRHVYHVPALIMRGAYIDGDMYIVGFNYEPIYLDGEDYIYIKRDGNFEFYFDPDNYDGGSTYGGITDLDCLRNDGVYECYYTRGWNNLVGKFTAPTFSFLGRINTPFGIHVADLELFDTDKFWVFGQECYTNNAFWAARYNLGTYDVNRYLTRTRVGECPGGLRDAVCFDFDTCFVTGDYSVYIVTVDSHIDILPEIDLPKDVCWSGYINCFTYAPMKLGNRIWFGYHRRYPDYGYTGTKILMYEYKSPTEGRFLHYGYLRSSTGEPIYVIDDSADSYDILSPYKAIAVGYKFYDTSVRSGIILVRDQVHSVGQEETYGAPVEGPLEISSCTSITESGDYVVTSDLYLTGMYPYCIDIFVDDVSVDCQNHKIELATDMHEYPNGIHIQSGVKNVSINNCEIIGFNGSAVFLRGSNEYITIRNVTIRDGLLGIWGDAGRYIDISGVYIYNMSGISIGLFGENIVISNILLEGNGSVDITAILIREPSNNVTIRDSTFRNFLKAMEVNMNNSLIYNNTIIKDIPLEEWEARIRIVGSENTTIAKNKIYSDDYGLGIWLCCPSNNNVTIEDNEIIDIFHAIGGSSVGVNIRNNYIVAKGTGIQIYQGRDIVAEGSTIIHKFGLSGYCMGYFNVENILIRNNTLIDDSSAFIFGAPLRNVTIVDNNITADVLVILHTLPSNYSISNVFACNNTATFNTSWRVTEPYFRDRGGYLVNVMRIESSSCEPYLSAIFNYTSIDFGSVQPYNTYDVVETMQIDSNMINITFSVSGTDLIGVEDVIPSTNIQFSPSKYLEFPTALVPIESIAKYVFYYLPNEFNNIVENLFRFSVPLVRPGIYTGTITVEVSI